MSVVATTKIATLGAEEASAVLESSEKVESVSHGGLSAFRLKRAETHSILVEGAGGEFILIS